MHTFEKEKIETDNWTLLDDCLNITGELSPRDIEQIVNIPKLRVIQPWKYMPSERTWLELNDTIFKNSPETKLHIWADTLKSDFNWLSKMSNVWYLDLNQIKFKVKDTLGNLTELKRLALINGNVNELHFLRNLHNLEELEIGRIKGLTDISFISELQSLKILDINNQSHIHTLPHFKKNINLQKITLINLRNLSEVSNIKEAVNIEEMIFHGLSNQVEPEQFDFLRELKKLTRISSHFNTKSKRERFEKFKIEVLKINT